MVQDRVQYSNREYSNGNLYYKGGEKFLEKLSAYSHSRNILLCAVNAN
jgi:hypothetical protein